MRRRAGAPQPRKLGLWGVCSWHVGDDSNDAIGTAVEVLANPICC